MVERFNLKDLMTGTLMESVNSPQANMNGMQGPVVEVNYQTGAVMVELPPPHGRTAMVMNRWAKVQAVNEDSEKGVLPDGLPRG